MNNERIIIQRKNSNLLDMKARKKIIYIFSNNNRYHFIATIVITFRAVTESGDFCVVVVVFARQIATIFIFQLSATVEFHLYYIWCANWFSTVLQCHFHMLCRIKGIKTTFCKYSNSKYFNWHNRLPSHVRCSSYSSSSF